MELTAPQRRMRYLASKPGTQSRRKRGRQMKGQSQTVVRVKEEPIVTKIGDAADFRKKMSAAIAKRAYEIYQRQGRRLGRDQENWRLAESEILQPLCCGMLHSNDGIAISLFCTAMGAKKLRELKCSSNHIA